MTWTRSNSGIDLRGRLLRRAAIACAVLALLSGCINESARKPDPAADPVPKTAPRTVGAQHTGGGEERNLIAAFGGNYGDAKVESLLDGVATRLVAASTEPGISYKITVLNSPTVNAFSLPDGHLYVTRGLVALANSTSEIAAVLAHEMAHVTARHAMQRIELEKSTALFSKVAAEVLNDPAGGQKLQEKSKLSLASFSRQQEFAADAIGIRTMAKSGYDPYGASRFLNSLARYAALRAATLGGAASSRPDMFSTHPATSERVQMALQSARQLNAPGVGEDDRGRYLAAIDGIAFGDDPSQGTVRGRSFIHTRLGFAFTAPEGFALSGGSEAVQGAAAALGRAMRFDTVEVPSSTPLDQYLKSGWIEGVEVTKETTLDVGGLSAETGIAKSGEWSFRLAAIRQGGVIYRLIYAARNFSPEADQSFMQSIASFHRLNAEEIARAKPLRLRIVTAGATDSVTTLSAGMSALGLPAEEFAVLNGLDKAGHIEAGAQYKVAAE
ncbi:Putative Zn-dependent protease [Rhizobiales bacterium GAS188]|nr:Putative Zn-dependent protease [Rhizobiales bacterium GAS188]